MTDTLSAEKASTVGVDADRWFMDQVKPHEPVLRAYLYRKFPALSDVDDVLQESYLRLFRAKAAGTLRSVRGFLFITARNIAFDVFRRTRTTSLEAVVEHEGAHILLDGIGPAEIVCRNHELALLAEAIESLPPACRQVLKLRKIYEYSHKEIASLLGISERTVNVQVGKGVRRCVEFLQARGLVLNAVRAASTKARPASASRPKRSAARAPERWRPGGWGAALAAWPEAAEPARVVA